MNDSSKKFVVECEVHITEDDVWDYLASQGKDIDELKENGYEFTMDDWENTAREMFENDDFTYYDFKEKR